MITLLILAQTTRDEFMDFKRQVEVQFAEINGIYNNFNWIYNWIWFIN
ncbi:MAG: hypothetical protein ACO2O6_00445 [Candidatus Hydrothermia bacterium]|jgi:hypothetical protein